MKILDIREDCIIFDNGNKISYSYESDSWEENYALFSAIDSIALNYEFESNLRFEYVDKSGFRFGDSRRMFFIPCYSFNNGYYTDILNILYNNKIVLLVQCPITDKESPCGAYYSNY